MDWKIKDGEGDSISLFTYKEEAIIKCNKYGWDPDEVIELLANGLYKINLTLAKKDEERNKNGVQAKRRRSRLLM